MSWRDRNSGAVTRRAVRNLFLFIGASPETAFLAGSTKRVGAAIGEGAAVVAALRRFLEAQKQKEATP